jgi:hypothetical protein
MLIRGGCHCGNLTFTLDWQPEPTTIPARACTCTFCLKHGGVWTSCRAGTLRVEVGQPERVSRYSFGTKTADFHVCASCGVVPVVTSRIAGRIYAVVNVNTFSNIDSALLQRTAATFDAEDESERLSRRQRNWIADVRFTPCHV